ncbi:MAG: hypothetical protein A3C08_00985 [Candidatus Taylorbacteria bacterium RIFCSPHIGHO2_02_FULL_47_18]|nr:MAG: hypothetical protein A3C08_00985 [Candidatus Taylorbacteria bacterium RIFCSPHIGHO2_02_FULL_47_18]
MNTHLLSRAGAGALFLVPLAPLMVYLGFLFPYMSGRNFFFRALVLVAFAAWLVLWFYKPEQYRPHKSFLSVAILSFIALVGIGTALSPNPYFAFWSSLERMDGLISVLFLAAFFFSARGLLDARHWKIFFHISLGTALAVSFVAVLQLLGVLAIHQGGVRIDGTFGNASFFAAYMLLSAGLAFFLAVGARASRARLAYLSCAVPFLFLMLASATRSAFVALPFALLISGIAAFFQRMESISIKRFCVISLACIALFTGAFIALKQIPSAVSHPLLGRILSISLTGQDAEARFLSWNIALQGAREQPLFGWGPEGFRHVFVKYYDPRLYGREQWFDRAHNTYLDWLVQAGSIGLLAYLALWFGLAHAVWHRDSPFSPWEKVTLSGMFAGYAAFNVFSFDTVTASILFFAFLAYAEWRFSERRQAVLQSTPPFAKRACRSSLIVLFVTAFLFIFYFTIAKPAYAAHLINEGLRNPSPVLETRLAFFTRAISLRTFATPEAREMLMQFAVDVRDAPLRDDSRAKLLTLAASELAKQIEQSPKDPRYAMRLGVLLNIYRQYEIAIPIIEQALALSPRKQPILYELGTSYLNLKQFDKAAEVFKFAAELLPENQDEESKKLYAVALIYAGKVTEAETYLIRIFGTTEPLESRLADAYARIGQKDKSERILWLIREREELEKKVKVIHTSQ